MHKPRNQKPIWQHWQMNWPVSGLTQTHAMSAVGGYNRGWCKKNWKNVFLYCVSNTYDYAFLCLYTQSRHFDNSKMVNWDNLVQKLTKIQEKCKNSNYGKGFH